MSLRRFSLGAVERAGPEFFARQAGVPRSARRLAGYDSGYSREPRDDRLHDRFPRDGTPGP